jgi:hypothetical protein
MDLDEKFSTKMVIQRIQAWSNSEGYGRNLGIRNWRDEKTITESLPPKQKNLCH